MHFAVYIYVVYRNSSTPQTTVSGIKGSGRIRRRSLQDKSGIETDETATGNYRNGGHFMENAYYRGTQCDIQNHRLLDATSLCLKVHFIGNLQQ